MPANQLTARLRVLKLIIAAMTGGLFAFAVIVVAVVASGSMEAHLDLAPIMMIVLCGLAVCEAVGYVVLRQGIIAKTRGFLRTHSDFGEPAAAIGNAFATLTIVAGAMLEGLGLFGAVIVLVTGMNWPWPPPPWPSSSCSPSSCPTRKRRAISRRRLPHNDHHLRLAGRFNARRIHTVANLTGQDFCYLRSQAVISSQ